MISRDTSSIPIHPKPTQNTHTHRKLLCPTIHLQVYLTARNMIQGVLRVRSSSTVINMIWVLSPSSSIGQRPLPPPNNPPTRFPHSQKRKLRVQVHSSSTRAKTPSAQHPSASLVSLADDLGCATIRNGLGKKSPIVITNCFPALAVRDSDTSFTRNMILTVDTQPGHHLIFVT